MQIFILKKHIICAKFPYLIHKMLNISYLLLYKEKRIFMNLNI